MGFANKTHWLGVFLLFAATVLILITTISAPVINRISLLHVNLPNGTDTSHSSITFGTFGWCVLNAADPNDSGAWCSPVQIGYQPAHVIAAADRTSFHAISGGTSDALTNVMVLHPVACGLSFLAFLVACGAGIVGSFAGALIALLAWILTLVALAIDFTVFGIIHHHVNDDVSNSNADFGTGIWCLVGAFVCLFFGAIIVFFTCCANRREKRRNVVVEKDVQKTNGQRKKRFGVF